MAYIVEIMDKAFYELLIDEEKLIDEDFMVGIFNEITKKLPPLQEFLGFMFENKQGRLMGSLKEVGNIFPWDLLRSGFFYHTHKDIVDTNSFCIELTCESASIFRVGYREKHKATAKYLSSIGGYNSMKKVEKK